MNHLTEDEQAIDKAMKVIDEVLALILKHVRPQLQSLPNALPDPRNPEQEFGITSLPSRVLASFPEGTAGRRLSSRLLKNAAPLLAMANSLPLDAPPEQLEPLLKYLSGVWLGLYFLGVPFIHPWEPVARHAERNGYQRGPAIFKAAGDVYREARRRSAGSSASRKAEQPATSMTPPKGPAAAAKPQEPEMLVLDPNPIAIRDRAFQDDRSPDFVLAAIGACYELLQLRLYLQEGGSIRHFVFRSTLQETLQKGADPRTGKDPADELWGLAQRSYGLRDGVGDNKKQQIVVIDPDETIKRMPPSVVLSTRQGIFRSRLRRSKDDESSSDEIYYGADGNRLTNTQRDLMRSVLLKREDRTEDFIVTASSKEKFKECWRRPKIEPLMRVVPTQN